MRILMLAGVENPLKRRLWFWRKRTSTFASEAETPFKSAFLSYTAPQPEGKTMKSPRRFRQSVLQIIKKINRS